MVDPGFILGGSAPVRNGVTDFFLQNTSCIIKPQVISGAGGGGRGVRTPASSPRSAPGHHLFE